MVQQEPVTVFLAYAHEDESLRSELEKHLSLLRRQGLISTWQDRQITAGIDWAQEIDTHLETASIILLLISADFLASDYCYGMEMQHALERNSANQARVIPLALRPCDWKDAPFAHLQALPTNAKAVTSWYNQDEAWTDVTKGIRRAVEELLQLSVNQPPRHKPRMRPQPKPRVGTLFRLSYPRIALIALIGQILSFGALTSEIYFFIHPHTNPDVPLTSIENLLTFIIISLSLGGIVCAVIALIMSLSKAQQLQRWGWFTGLIIGFIGLLILFLPALIPLLFGLFGPKEQRAAQTRN